MPLCDEIPIGKLVLKQDELSSRVFTPAALQFEHYLTRKVLQKDFSVQSATISVDGSWKNCYVNGVPAQSESWKNGRVEVFADGRVKEILSDKTEINYDLNGNFISLKTPRGQTFNASQLGVEVLRDGSGALRQIWSLTDGLLDVVVAGTQTYEIRWYKNGDFLDKDASGFYVPAGTQTVVEMNYDSQGRRFEKKVTVAGTTTLHQRYIYRGFLQIAALDLLSTNLVAAHYILWDPTQPTATRPLAIQTAGTWFVYGHDLTKNVCEVFGQHGYIRESYSYSPFGNVSASGDVSQPFQWSSEFYDSELDLIYYNYRHYSPSLGRWLSRDPIEETGGLNLYCFVGNNPVFGFDILGHALIRLEDNSSDFKESWGIAFVNLLFWLSGKAPNKSVHIAPESKEAIYMSNSQAGKSLMAFLKIKTKTKNVMSGRELAIGDFPC